MTRRASRTDDSNHATSFSVHYGEQSPRFRKPQQREALFTERMTRIANNPAQRIAEDSRRFFERHAMLKQIPRGLSRVPLEFQGQAPIIVMAGSTRLRVWLISKNKMAKKKSVSSRREKRVPASALFTTPFTDKQRRDLQRLARKADKKIDFSDAPEQQPSETHIGKFYRPIKQLVSIRLDADVLAWFRARGKRYRTYMNEVLRREMKANQGRDTRSSCR
jgi:uncharacterized protein (DUF4415 family)